MEKDEKKVAKKVVEKKETTKKVAKKSEPKASTKATAKVTEKKAVVTEKKPKTVAKKTEKKVEKEVKKEQAVKAEVKKEIKKEEASKEVNASTVNVKKIKNVSTDKVVIFTIVGICVLIALAVFGFVFYKSNYEGVVSTKYGVVTKAEYTVYYKMFAPMLEYYGYTVSQIPEVIANKAGTDKVILKKAEEAGVTLSAEDAAAVEEVFSDKDQISTWQQSGINITILRKLYEEDYIISAYIEKMAQDATSEQMLEYLKSTYGDEADLYGYNTRHILIKTTTTDESGASAAMSDADKATALSKAQGLLARAQAGEDFATLATENSEDTGTATNGGVFTFCDGDSVLEQYKTAAKTLSDGQIYSQVVETSAGYHIIKMDSKTENGRVNSQTERNYYANEIINNYSTTEDIEIKTDVLNRLIESITGKAVEQTTDENNNTTVDTNSTSDTPVATV